jgi:hypothetical protein
VRLERSGALKKKSVNLIRSRTRDLPACSIASQPSMLQLILQRNNTTINDKLSVLYTKLTVMKYVLLRTVVHILHHGLLFIPLRYTYVDLTSPSQFTSFYFTSLRLTAFFDDFY